MSKRGARTPPWLMIGVMRMAVVALGVLLAASGCSGSLHRTDASGQGATAGGAIAGTSGTGTAGRSGCPLPPVRTAGQLVSCCGPGVSCNGTCVGLECLCPDIGGVSGGCPPDSVCCSDGCHPFVAGFACPPRFTGSGGSAGGTAGGGGAGGNGAGGGGGDCSPPSMSGSKVACCAGIPCYGECHDGQCVCPLGGGNFTAGCSDGLMCCLAYGCVPPEIHCPPGPA